MSRQKDSKLQSLLHTVRGGFLIDTPTLARLGITRQLAHKYVESGWLEPVVRGLYRRPAQSEEVASWQSVVRSIQSIMEYDSIVGGRTALNIQDFTHYLEFGGPHRVHLYGTGHPTWLKRLPSEESYLLHGTRLFKEDTLEYTETNTAAGSLSCSSPERAILELLDELPQSESFHVVDTFFEALVSMRPKALTRLLESCTSVKVKRLFFVFADRHQHSWRKHLSAQDFDLGSGPRNLVEGGRYHANYKITVPKEILGRAGDRADGE